MFRLQICLLAVIVGLSSGCSTTRTSDTARTGLEQMLISNAIDQAIDANHFSSVAGRSVFLEEKYLDCTDKPYVVGTIRNRVLDAGGRLVEAADKADVVMEVRSGGVGTDNSEKFIGIPGLTVPGLPVELPEVRLWEKNAQFGTAKIAITSIDAKSGEQLGISGNLLARSNNSRWSVLGFSTGDAGSVNQELAQAKYQSSGSFAAPVENFAAEIIATKPKAWR